ncbi:unnamed protein product [Periconia digitata]|uniref:Uncharacterized protein n=1 Tax=Periconia digitata TaxID=1303443 RepID=A0A9W4UW56_9PLEO|nr:unnamed protein product [Periconia digitata]
MKSVGSLALACLGMLPCEAFGANDIHYASSDEITLKSNGNEPGVTIIDFGEAFEGHPTFEVVSASNNTLSLEVSYAESSTALNLYMSDGPIKLAAAMDSYRVKRYNISKPKVFENRLVQGAFRYQKLNLSSAGELRLRNIGVRPTIHTTPIRDLPGFFESSDEDLSRIWVTGARTVQLTEIPKHSIPDFWLVSSEGSLVEALTPQNWPGGGALTSYNISVDVKPVTGAFTVGVHLDTLNIGPYIVIDLVGGRITATNSNGDMIADIKTEPYRPTGFVSALISVQVSKITISIDNNVVASFSQTVSTFGSFGLGAPFANSAMFKNLKVTDLTSGRVAYNNSLTDRAFLKDFLMGDNPLNTIVDGSRRDRIAYNGDLDVSTGVNFASTYNMEFVEGSLNLLGSYQLSAGPFIPTAKIQQAPLPFKIPGERTGLIGYSFNLVCAMAQVYYMSGNETFAKKWAPSIVSMLNWADSKLENDRCQRKVQQPYAYSLQQSTSILKAVGVDTTLYETRLTNLRKAINNRLWNPELGAYSLSSEISNGFAQDAQAFAILANVPQSGNISAAALLQTMEKKLLLNAGPLAFSPETAEYGFARKISPYASSYHLRAAFDAGESDSAMRLLKTLWAPMADPLT